MTRQEYTALVDRCKQLSYEYYVMSQPSVSDAQFDALVNEIEQAEAEHPEWTLADSPTQQVGSDLQDNGRRLIAHRTRMLSCQKAQTQEAVSKWINTTEKKLNKVNDLHYVLEWKLDGISCSLVYLDGRLISAATRGDKDRGQDLLSHVQMMPSVPQQITMAGRVEVRGEIVCPKAELSSLGYKDCRTAASALTNQMVPTEEVSRLVFMAWQMDSDDEPFGTETASIDVAQEQGFMTTDRKGCWGEKVLQLLDEFEAKREAYPYPTDGVVIKIDHKPLADSMGCTEHHPKGNIAYKFTANKATTRVLRIEVKVAESGRRTPVAYLQPVMIMGREVSKASLYSERKMEELGVTEGCTVEVGLSNDVTPKIYRVLHDSNHATEGGLLPTENNLQAKPEDATPAAAGDTNTETNIATDQGTASREARQPIFENNGDAPEPTALSNSAPKPKRQRRKKKAAEPKPQQLSLFDQELQQEQEEPAANKLMRGAGYLAAATLAIIIVYQTGLIIPLGLIGLATSGLLR